MLFYDERLDANVQKMTGRTAGHVPLSSLMQKALDIRMARRYRKRCYRTCAT